MRYPICALKKMTPTRKHMLEARIVKMPPANGKPDPFEGFRAGDFKNSTLIGGEPQQKQKLASSGISLPHLEQ